MTFHEDPRKGSRAYTANIAETVYLSSLHAKGCVRLSASEYAIYLDSLRHFTAHPAFDSHSDNVLYKRLGTASYFEVPTQYAIDGNVIKIEVIDRESLSTKYRNVFFQWVFGGLTNPRDTETIRSHLDNGGRIAFFRKAPSEQFCDGYRRYANRHFSGHADLANIISAYHGMKIIRAINHNAPLLTDSPRMSELEQLIRISINDDSMHFVALPSDLKSDHEQEQLVAAMAELNKELDQYEYAYDILNASALAEKKQLLFALSVLGLSTTAPELLQQITQSLGEGVAMTSAQMMGDAADQAINAADRIYDKAFTPAEKEIIPIANGNDHRLKSLSKGEMLKKRLGVAGANLIVAATLSAISTQLSELPQWQKLFPFLLIGPLNKVITVLVEAEERYAITKAVYSDLHEDDRAIVRAFIKTKFPKQCAKMIDAVPEFFLAIADLNNATIYSLMGASVALPVLELILLVQSYLESTFSIRIGPEEIMAAAGITFEAGGTALFSLIDIYKDAGWKRFLNIMPLLQKFDLEADQSTAQKESQ